MTNLDLVEQQLFADPKVRDRLVKDYGLSPAPTTPAELSRGLVTAFGQRPLPDPLNANVSYRDVYRAAVLALASNSRSWSSFIAREPQLAELLRGYDPQAVASAVATGALTAGDLAACIPGQTSSADARAMLSWADLIANAGGYYQRVVAIARAFERAGAGEHEVVPCVSAFLGHPPSDKMLAKCLPGLVRPAGLETSKAPGMGATLASEFLRNLGWSGFKPDRHIQRLFSAWFPEVVKGCHERAVELAALVGRRAKDVVAFFTFSLVGHAVTPPGRTLSEADNLVWALGAYVEKKGRESVVVYRRDG